MEDDVFEWDERKRRANIAKHGIDFRDIPSAFRQPHIEDYDHRHSRAGEDRWKVLGMVKGQVVFFVYAERDGGRRIITARAADRRETVLYFSRFWFQPWS